MAYFVKYMFDTSTHDLHTEVDAQDRHIRNAKGTSTHDLHTEVDACRLIILPDSKTLQLTTSTRRSTIPCHIHNIQFYLLQLTTSTRRSTLAPRIGNPSCL